MATWLYAPSQGSFESVNLKLVKKLGTLDEIQKNSMNDQDIKLDRVLGQPNYCPVMGITNFPRANDTALQRLDDPLWKRYSYVRGYMIPLCLGPGPML